MPPYVTVAHELAHCLLASYKLNFGRKHEPEHTELTQDIEAPYGPSTSLGN